METVSLALKEEKLDAVICVAGGWAGGNAQKGLHYRWLEHFEQVIYERVRSLLERLRSLKNLEQLRIVYKHFGHLRTMLIYERFSNTCGHF